MWKSLQIADFVSRCNTREDPVSGSFWAYSGSIRGHSPGSGNGTGTTGCRHIRCADSPIGGTEPVGGERAFCVNREISYFGLTTWADHPSARLGGGRSQSQIQSP